MGSEKEKNQVALDIYLLKYFMRDIRPQFDDNFYICLREDLAGRLWYSLGWHVRERLEIEMRQDVYALQAD